MSDIGNIGGTNFSSWLNTSSNFSSTKTSSILDNFDDLDIRDPYSSLNLNQKSSGTNSFGSSSGGDVNSFMSYLSNLQSQITDYFTKLFSGIIGDDGSGTGDGTDFGDIDATMLTASSNGNQAPASTEGNNVQTPAPTQTGTTQKTSTKETPSSGTSSIFSKEPQQGLLTEAQAKERAEQLTTQLMKDFDLTKEQAAGIVGNMMHESAGLNANINQYGFANGGGPGAPSGDRNQGYGWVQWSYDRKEAYLAYSKQQGLDPASPAANYAFLKHELQTSESGTIAAIKNTHTAEDAAVAFRKVYERAENPVDSSRIAAAKQVNSWVA